jgi:hypothetical protein
MRIEGRAIYRTRGRELGVAAGERRDTFSVRGLAELDRGSGQVCRFDVVALCVAGHFDEIGRQVTALGVAFALTPAKDPRDRVRPHSFFHDYYGKK